MIPPISSGSGGGWRWCWWPWWLVVVEVAVAVMVVAVVGVVVVVTIVVGVVLLIVGLPVLFTHRLPINNVPGYHGSWYEYEYELPVTVPPITAVIVRIRLRQLLLIASALLHLPCTFLACTWRSFLVLLSWRSEAPFMTINSTITGDHS